MLVIRHVKGGGDSTGTKMARPIMEVGHLGAESYMLLNIISYILYVPWYSVVSEQLRVELHRSAAPTDAVEPLYGGGRATSNED